LEKRKGILTMIKLIENIFFTTTISYKATLPGSQMNPAGIFSRNASVKVGIRNKDGEYREVNKSIDENDRTSLNFMEWFVKEKPDDEIYTAGNSDNMKIAGDGKTEKEAIYSTEGDPANTYTGERFEQDISYE
jgi:hypothetical protein